MIWLNRDCKDLPKRTAADKVYRDKVFSSDKNGKYGNIRGLASTLYKSYDKMFSGDAIKREMTSKQRTSGLPT